MPFDIENEETMTMAEATRRFPGRKRVHINTLYRWRTTGCHGVILECYRDGHGYRTSVEAMHRFIQRLNPKPTAAPETPARRAKRNESAKAELHRLGVGTQ